jgi:hypothetical protein
MESAGNPSHVRRGIGVGIVAGINQWAGNYGWVVLFRVSFIGPGYPAQCPHYLTVREYLAAVAHGSYGLVSLISIWILLRILAWQRRPSRLLIVLAAVAAAHFFLDPSTEDRYLVWAYIVVGAELINSWAVSINRERRISKAAT